MRTKLLQLFETIQHWWKRWAIASVLSVALAVLVYLVTGRNGDIVAWVAERTPNYPSPQTKNLSLPLSLSQTAANL